MLLLARSVSCKWRCMKSSTNAVPLILRTRCMQSSPMLHCDLRHCPIFSGLGRAPPHDAYTISYTLPLPAPTPVCTRACTTCPELPLTITSARRLSYTSPSALAPVSSHTYSHRIIRILLSCFRRTLLSWLRFCPYHPKSTPPFVCLHSVISH